MTNKNENLCKNIVSTHSEYEFLVTVSLILFVKIFLIKLSILYVNTRANASAHSPLSLRRKSRAGEPRAVLLGSLGCALAIAHTAIVREVHTCESQVPPL